MSLNSDKIGFLNDAPYVMTNKDYLRYDEIGRMPEEEVVETTGTAGLTLAQDSPGPSSTTQQGRLGAMTPEEIIPAADTSVNITETLSTPTLTGDVEAQESIKNFLTVNEQAEDQIKQTSLENSVIENPGQPTTEEVTLSATAKPTPVSTEFMFQDGTSLPSGYRQDVATQKTVTSLNQESMKEVLGLYEQIAKAQSELDAKGMKFDEQEINATKKAMEEMRESEEAFKVQREARLRAQKEREDKLLNDINTLNEQYRAVEIEPNRIFKNTSTGAKILAAISVGLGAYAASMTGGRNYAMEIIDGAIADDIQAQKLELQQKGAAIDDKRNLLNDLINQGMSEAEAEEASRLMLLQKAKRTLDERLLDIKDARMKEDAKNLDERLNLKIAETKANLMMKAIPQERMVTETKLLPTAKLSAELAQMKENAKLSAQRKFQDEQGLPKKEIDARTVQGYIGLAPDPTDARKMREAVAGSNAIIKQLEELVAFREKHGFELVNRKVVADGKSLATTVALELKSEPFFNLGVLTGPDLDLIEDTMPLDPTEASFGVISRYKSVIEYIKMKRDLKAAGLGLIAERPEMDATDMDFRQSVKQSQEAALAE
jgi:hypothetical protein